MKKILIVEDEKMLADMYRERFQQEGYEIYSAVDAESGLEMLQEVKPDLVVLDILLPKENGISFLKSKNNMKDVVSIPVIAFSNYDDIETKKEAKELGAKDYLIKTNHTPREILEKIKYYLENAENTHK